jgi:hypothetical protein
MNDTQAFYIDRAGIRHRVEFKGQHLSQLAQAHIAQELFEADGIEPDLNKIVLQDLPRQRPVVRSGFDADRVVTGRSGRTYHPDAAPAWDFEG